MEYFSLSLPEYLLIGILFFLWLIQIIYLSFYKKLHTSIKRQSVNEEATDPSAYPPLSIVITAHNRASFLLKNLPYIMEQEYPEFEVIVVNNTSSDDTNHLLASYKSQYPNFYYTFIPHSSRNPSNKKLALSLGIKACKYEWVVFTEPECIPSSPLWLQRMARNFTSSTEIVLGYSKYKKEKGGFFTKIRLLNLFEQIRFLSFATLGKPYMGYGRNLAYRKSFFFKHRGYSGHLNLKRGEDDLFLNRVANGWNTRVELSPESVTEVASLPSPKLWSYEQRQRKETYRLLNGSQTTLWEIETISRILFLLTANLCLIYGLFTQQWIIAALAFLLILTRFSLFFFFIRKICKALKEPYFNFILLFFTWIQLTHSLSSPKNHHFQS